MLGLNLRAREVQGACRWGRPQSVLRSRASMDRALIVIGKAPIPGETKTRLVPPLSAHEAAALYRGFLLDTLQLATSLHWERTSLIHPRGHADLLRPIAQGAQLVEQPGKGLDR